MPIVLLVSAPEDALSRAKAHVENHDGYDATLPRNHAINDKRVRFSSVLKELDWAALKTFIDLLLLSWVVKKLWFLRWQGRVSMALEVFLKHPKVIAVAIEGG